MRERLVRCEHQTLMSGARIHVTVSPPPQMRRQPALFSPRKGRERAPEEPPPDERWKVMAPARLAAVVSIVSVAVSGGVSVALALLSVRSSQQVAERSIQLQQKPAFMSD